MADMLAEVDDLEDLLGQTLDADKATMLIECATAVIQEIAGGQRIVQVVDDTIASGDFMGTADPFLQLPQWPVTAVSNVTVDGTALTAGTDYKRVASRLWRRCGWMECPPEPSLITLTYTHGYPSGHQKLQFGRAAVIGLIRDMFDNPTGATQESIDDYSVAYNRMTEAMEANAFLKAAIRRAYGAHAGPVRI